MWSIEEGYREQGIGNREQEEPKAGNREQGTGRANTRGNRWTGQEKEQKRITR
jgi:hypothetical protein